MNVITLKYPFKHLNYFIDEGKIDEGEIEEIIFEENEFTIMYRKVTIIDKEPQQLQPLQYPIASPKELFNIFGNPII